jgi:Flp pilus assembly protein TadD
VSRRTPVDPRLTLATPYRNVRPEVKYVGDQACAGCHAELMRSYHGHPMARSILALDDATLPEPDVPHTADFQALGYHYRVERRGNRIVHREAKEDPQGHVLAEIEAEVQFAVGSGTRGRSYLVTHDGYLFQSPITWYPQRHKWDLSPGYTTRHHHFSRPVPADCLFCHSNRVEEVAGSVNHYRLPIFQGYAIGCERCHGPGELHVRRQQQGGEQTEVDTTIVNPRRLEPALRDAVCEQCHLQGEVRVLRRGRDTFDYRPGLPLHPFMSVFVAASSGETKKFVGHVEQMHASRCFTASAGKMGCITCHDPHRLPAAAERVAYYRERCLTCHSEKSCSLPADKRLQQEKQDSCIACHMPAGKSDIPHASTTDHRIPRVVEPAPAVERAPRPRGTDELPLLLFHQDAAGRDDPEIARDLGIALVDRIERYPELIRRALAQRALPLLEKAVQEDEGDAPTWQARANALWANGRTEEAAAAFAAILTKVPQQEASLHSAATLAMELGRPEAARGYWERALRVNPWRYEFHYGLAAARAQRGDWPRAIPECQRALQLNPFRAEVRRLLIRCYLANGAEEPARREFERLVALEPADADALRLWYAERAKEAQDVQRKTRISENRKKND